MAPPMRKMRTAELTKVKKEMEELEREELRTEAMEQKNGDAEWSPIRRRMFDFLVSQRTEYLLCAVILSNLFLLVMETDLADSNGNAPLWIEILNKVMLAFFTVELSIRLYTFRLELFKDASSALDAFIVIADILALFLRLLLPDLPTFGMMRIVRLLRLSRSSEIIEMVPQLHIIVMSLVGAITPLFWGFVMLAMLLMTWGILAVQVIHPIAQDVAKSGAFDGCDRCARAFETVWQSALTFTQQIIAGDSWGTVTVPIIEYSPGTVVFFAAVFVSLNMALMNVILASVVDAVGQARLANDRYLVAQKDRELKAANRMLEEACMRLDCDGSGCLTYEELKQGFENDLEFRISLEAMDIKNEDIPTVWGILDTDDSGDVSYKEFCDQVFKMKTSDMHTMLVFVRHYVSAIHKQVSESLVEIKLEKEQMLGIFGQVSSDIKGINEEIRKDVSELQAELFGGKAVSPIAPLSPLASLQSADAESRDEAGNTKQAAISSSSAEAGKSLLALPGGQNPSFATGRFPWQDVADEQRQFMSSFMDSVATLKDSINDLAWKFDNSAAALNSIVSSSGSPPTGTPFLDGIPPQPQPWLSSSACCGKQESKKQHDIQIIRKDGDSEDSCGALSGSGKVPATNQAVSGSLLPRVAESGDGGGAKR